MPSARIDLRRLAGALASAEHRGASMAELARAAGVAKPTLYSRFGSRAELVAACVEAEAERLLDRLYRQQDPVEAVVAYARRSPGWRLLLLADDPIARAARRRVAARLAGEAGMAPLEGAALLGAAAAVLDQAGPHDPGAAGALSRFAARRDG